MRDASGGSGFLIEVTDMEWYDETVFSDDDSSRPYHLFILFTMRRRIVCFHGGWRLSEWWRTVVGVAEDTVLVR